MKGFARKIDNLGRLVIPAEMRRAHGIETGELVEMENTSAGILIRSAKTHCVMCGRTDYLIEVNGAAICESCIVKANFERNIRNEE